MTPKRSPLSTNYPISQPQFAGVGIMPSVKLAQTSDHCVSRPPRLSAHNSSMFGSSSVKVKIAPPDAARSPPSYQLVVSQTCDLLIVLKCYTCVLNVYLRTAWLSYSSVIAVTAVFGVRFSRPVLFGWNFIELVIFAASIISWCSLCDINMHAFLNCGSSAREDVMSSVCWI